MSQTARVYKIDQMLNDHAVVPFNTLMEALGVSRATNHPEFDAWRWNDYWVPLDVVVEFKRGVYEMALT